MNKKNIKQLIEDGFNRLHEFDHIDWRHYTQEMFESELKLEKSHRSNRPLSMGGKFGNSATLSAKYFVIKFFGRALKDCSISAKDALWCRPASITAKGIVDAWPERSRQAFDGFDWDSFNSLDYADASIVSNMEVAA